jgi:hypothetical protein
MDTINAEAETAAGGKVILTAYVSNDCKTTV